jgi:pimeloyl-ACP methyl ester carboxylesterase
MKTYLLTRSRLGGGLAALVVTAIALVSPTPGTRAAEAVVPPLSWTDCGDGFHCGTMTVPLDYSRPAGRRISLSLIKLPASDPARRIGSLFINPGGPGISAVATVRHAARLIYTPEVRARFDVIGMDPRGVGGSTTVRCYDSAQEEADFEANYPMFPVTRAEQILSARKDADLAARCWARSGWELAHLSTANVARDMDLVRRAVGDTKLYYAGYSYGSYLGETYANLFPDRVAAMVLDSVLDPTRYALRQPGRLGTMPFLRERSDVGSSDTLSQFFTRCRQAGPAKCPLATDGDPAAAFAVLADRVRTHPVTATTPAGPVRVGYAELVSFTVNHLYTVRQWPALADALHRLYLGDAALIANQLPSRAGGQLVDEQQLGVACSELDTVDDHSALPTVAAAAEHRSRYAGTMWTYAAAPCISWPQHDRDRYLGPWNHPTATPVLIVNSQHDPATPYDNAVALQHIIPGSVLLTHAGWGHETLLVSACVDRAVERYLTAGVLPAPGTVCHPDTVPFG